MRIQHNIMAMNAYRNLGINNKSLSKNLEKLSSGYRINRAGDDAAGLAISEKMRAQIAGLDQAQKNAQSGINMVQTAEGALTEVHDMLNRMVTLATQAANGTYTTSDQTKIQSEITALTEEIDRIASNANFNGQKLLDGSLSTEKTYLFDADADAANGKAAVDFSIKVGQYDSDGDDEVDTADFTFALATTTGTAGAELADDGTLTISLKTGTSYTADQIKNLLNSVTTTGFATDAAGTALETAMTNAVKAATVSGDGITAKATDTDFGTDASTDNFGGDGDALVLQIGADSVETIDVKVDTMSAQGLGIDALDLTSVKGANEAIDTINAAIEKVSVQRSNLGAIQNRLEHTINNLGVMEENIQDAEANIRDTDIADEMMAYTKNNILIQSAQAMLAQANQVPQGVLQLMQ